MLIGFVHNLTIRYKVIRANFGAAKTRDSLVTPAVRSAAINRTTCHAIKKRKEKFPPPERFKRDRSPANPSAGAMTNRLFRTPQLFLLSCFVVDLTRTEPVEVASGAPSRDWSRQHLPHVGRILSLTMCFSVRKGRPWARARGLAAADKRGQRAQSFFGEV